MGSAHRGQPLPFLYEAIGVITRFTDQRDPKPRSPGVFTFHRPETLRELLSQEKSLRSRLLELPALIPINLRACQFDAVTELDGSRQESQTSLARRDGNGGRQNLCRYHLRLSACSSSPGPSAFSSW